MIRQVLNAQAKLKNGAGTLKRAPALFCHESRPAAEQPDRCGNSRNSECRRGRYPESLAAAALSVL